MRKKQNPAEIEQVVDKEILLKAKLSLESDRPRAAPRVLGVL